MIKYKKFQFGWTIVITFIILFVWMTFAFINQLGNNPVDIIGYILFLTIFIGILLTFYGMTVIVTDQYLKIIFGIGIYSKKIDLSTIASVSTQNNPYYYGFGIRFLSNGTLYNVNGKHAVEIRFKGKKKVIQIGTNDLENLRNVIEKNIII